MISQYGIEDCCGLRLTTTNDRNHAATGSWTDQLAYSNEFYHGYLGGALNEGNATTNYIYAVGGEANNSTNCGSLCSHRGVAEYSAYDWIGFRGCSEPMVNSEIGW